MSEPVYVWVAERGCYSDRYLAGVFDSWETAKASFSADFVWTCSSGADEDGGYVDYINDKDWDDHVIVTRTLVEVGSPVPTEEQQQ